MCRWNALGALPSLATLDVANNNLSGVLPAGLGTPQSVLITQGDLKQASCWCKKV